MIKYDIYGVGNALVDIEFEVDEAFLTKLGITKGQMTLVDEERQTELLAHLKGRTVKRICGGSAANTVMALQYFGGKAFYSCKVGDDEMGDFFLSDIQSIGVSSNLTNRAKNGLTGKCLVLVTPDAERSMNTFLGVSIFLSPKDLVPIEIRQSKFLYIEGYLANTESGTEAACVARDIARNSDVGVALTFSDPSTINYSRRSLEKILMGGVDLLFCNEAEALLWTETTEISEAAKTLEKIARTFVITLGAKGCMVFDGAQITKVSALPVKKVRDTTGAGDMFAGAFIYALQRDCSYAEAAQFACLSAAKVLTVVGPRLLASEYVELRDIYF